LVHKGSVTDWQAPGCEQQEGTCATEIYPNIISVAIKEIVFIVYKSINKHPASNSFMLDAGCLDK
jgi:hypothetical protein